MSSYRSVTPNLIILGLVILLLGTFNSAVAQTEQPSLQSMRVTALGAANVRADASTRNSPIATLKIGETAAVLEQISDGEAVNGNATWYHIQLDDGTQGFVWSGVVTQSALLPANTAAPDSGDARLLFSAARLDYDLYTMNLSGGQPQRLATATYSSGLSWSPDGDRLIFTARTNGSGQLMVIDATGNNEHALTTTSQNLAYPAWSPDGRQIAYTNYSKGYPVSFVMNTDGSNAHPLISRINIQAVSANWSPDGQGLVFTALSSGRDIYSVVTEGQSLRRLVSDGKSFSPVWSPDETQIAFVSERDGSPQIYVMDASGNNVRRLTNEGENYSPTWSPDGQQIAFVSRSGTGSLIDSIRVDSSNRHHLTSQVMQYDSVDWSPDGTTIAFVAGDFVSHVEAIATNGSGVYTLPDDGNGFSPAWSPDGQQIAFLSSHNGDNTLYLISADGSNLRAFHPSTCSISAFAYSPTNDVLAVVSGDATTGGSICRFSLDGGGERQLVDSLPWPVSLVWSPDGSSIAFTCAPATSICAMDPDGTHKRTLTIHVHPGTAFSWSPDGTRLAYVAGSPLTNFVSIVDRNGENDQPLIPSSARSGTHVNFPVWSPDGARLAFVSDRDGQTQGNNDIYVCNSDGTQLHRLTHDATYKSGLAWSPDGQEIAFSASSAGQNDVYVVRANGAQLVRLTNTKDVFEGGTVWHP